MNRKRILPIVIVLAALVGAVVLLRRQGARPYYTGFVEGEERVIRAEVPGRVVEVRFGEGERVPANDVVARLDDQDVQARLAAKRQEIAVLEANLRVQDEKIALVETTWKTDRKARIADRQQAEAAAELAERSFARERELAKSGASTAQQLDDARSRRDQARSALDRAREMVARAEAEEREIAVARQESEVLKERRALAAAEVATLEVSAAKHTVRSPAVATVVQTQYLWPGELAEPGSALVSVLDPTDKYVLIWVPVGDLGRIRLGQGVEIELDSAPGRLLPGEVSFIADKASFTPEKIETRSDRLGQVVRAKVRILEGVEDFKPGAEGNVYLVEGERPRASQHAERERPTGG
jgi:HlyD family secretion protein